MKRVLVVDDDRSMRRTLQIMLEGMGLASAAAASAEDALEQLRSARFDLVLSDLKMPGVSGIELLERIRSGHPGLPVILITAYGTVQTAIEAMKRGASDFVLKPFDNESLGLIIRKALELERFRTENRFLREQAGGAWAAEDVFLSLPSQRPVADFIEKVAAGSGTVLITGETGTGKELAARCIHRRSPRSGALFVPVNCAALPAELVESELFGHRRGAFTGAQHDRQGKFEVASGGTLFLDEIGDMPPALQAKLLRVLEEGVIEPVGSNRRVAVDVRVIAATNQDLQKAIDERRFRSDLYYRLNTFELHLAPLRERRDDVAILAPLFLEHFARELGKGALRLSEPALEVLRQHDWPGNVRELRNLMERAAVLCSAPEVPGSFFRSMLPAATGTQAAVPLAADPPTDRGTPRGLDEAMAEHERRLILAALGATRDNKAEAARRLRISERTLWYKLRRHGL